MDHRITLMTAGPLLFALFTASTVGCESDEFADAPRAEAPEESMVGEQSPRNNRQAKRRSGQTVPSDHPPVGGARGATDSQKQAEPSGDETGNRGANLPVEWTAPEGWTATEPSSSMRAAQFRLAGTDQAGPATLAVFHFAGQGGGSVRANIDRWVGQFSQPDGGSSTEAADITEKTVQGLDIHVVDVSGTYDPGSGMGAGKPKKDHRMLGAIVETDAGLVFFKLTGARETVAAHRGEFRQFLESFRPAN